MKAKIYYGSFDSVRNQINRDKVSLRLDCHFNSSWSTNANYSLTEISKYSQNSLRLAEILTMKTAESLSIKNNGVNQLGRFSRGYTIVKNMNCSAVLWEPCFCSNPSGAYVIKHKRSLLHKAFLDTINQCLPKNTVIALVPGHAHKKTNDAGASVYDGGTEGWYAQLLVNELLNFINKGELVKERRSEDMQVEKVNDKYWLLTAYDHKVKQEDHIYITSREPETITVNLLKKGNHWDTAKIGALGTLDFVKPGEIVMGLIEIKASGRIVVSARDTR